MLQGKKMYAGQKDAGVRTIAIAIFSTRIMISENSGIGDLLWKGMFWVKVIRR